MKNKKKLQILALCIVSLLAIPSIVSAEESDISVKFKRNVGTDMGDGRRIRGDWTISGSGPDGTTKIFIFFNDSEVYSVQGKEFSFRFNTEDYWVGEVNITVRAYTSESEFVSRSFIKEFIDSSFDTMIYLFTGGISAIVIIFYGISYKKSKDKAKKEIKIDDVRIDS